MLCWTAGGAVLLVMKVATSRGFRPKLGKGKAVFSPSSAMELDACNGMSDPGGYGRLTSRPKAVMGDVAELHLRWWSRRGA